MGWIKQNKNDCKRATFLMEKQQEVALNFSEKIKLKAHLYGCSWCKTYGQQSKNLHLMIANFFHQPFSKPEGLPENFKNKLKTLITDKLKEN